MKHNPLPITSLLLAVAFTAVPVQAQEKQQYIDDEISITVRAAPRNDASYLGVVRSGDKVTVLESLGPESFAQVRLADGSEGWIAARYLTDEPAAKDALDASRRQVREAQARIQDLERDLQQTRESLDKARPALELAQENDQLRVQIADLQRATEDVRQRYNEQKAARRTMLTGAGLVGAGVLGGLILPWLGSTRRRRRYGDF